MASVENVSRVKPPNSEYILTLVGEQGQDSEYKITVVIDEREISGIYDTHSFIV